jgi:hypothetical protein
MFLENTFVKQTDLVSTLIRDRDTQFPRLCGTHATIMQPTPRYQYAPFRMKIEIKTPNVDTAFGQINHIRTSPHY